LQTLKKNRKFLVPQSKALTYLVETLNTNQIQEFLNPFDQTEMNALTVVRFLKKDLSEYIVSPKVQEYFEYPELAA
jgi:hypothetical protein